MLFVIALAPTMGLKPFVFQWLSTVADRYAYLAMLGPAIAVAMLADEYRARPAVAWICATVLILLAGRSLVQGGVWRDRSTLMCHALLVNPDSPLAHNHVGDELFRYGDIPDAEKHFVRAVELAPTYLSARDNLAVTLLRQGRHREALQLLEATLAMKEALPSVLAQPTDQDLKMIAAARKALAATQRATSRATSRPAK
jgi:Flp pilus assembly protein TadD